MKKTTLLSLATAAAVITTSVGTFAAYDTLSANNGEGAALTFKNPVTVQMNLEDAEVDSRSLGEAPTVTTTATVTVSNDDNLATKVTLSFDMGGTDGATLVEGTHYTLDVKADDSYGAGSATVVSKNDNINFEDSNATTGQKNYDVTVKLTEEGAKQIAEKGAGADVKLAMTATLS